MLCPWEPAARAVCDDVGGLKVPDLIELACGGSDFGSESMYQSPPPERCDDVGELKVPDLIVPDLIKRAGGGSEFGSKRMHLRPPPERCDDGGEIKVPDLNKLNKRAGKGS